MYTSSRFFICTQKWMYLNERSKEEEKKGRQALKTLLYWIFFFTTCRQNNNHHIFVHIFVLLFFSLWWMNGRTSADHTYTDLFVYAIFSMNICSTHSRVYICINNYRIIISINHKQKCSIFQISQQIHVHGTMNGAW